MEDDEFLGSVALFLPHYDETASSRSFPSLRTRTPGSPVKVERRAELTLYRRAEDKEGLFDALSEAPTYVLETGDGKQTRVA